MNAKPHKTATLTAAILCAAAIFAGCYWLSGLFIEQKKELKESARAAPEHFITYSGFPDGIQIEAQFLQGRKAIALNAQGGEIFLTPELKENFHLPYQVKAAFRTDGGKYKDFTWSINEKGLEYNITVSGFSPDDEVSLILNGEKSLTVPFDWAGKIEFPVITVNNVNHINCIKILQANHEEYELCHSLTGKDGDA